MLVEDISAVVLNENLAVLLSLLLKTFLVTIDDLLGFMFSNFKVIEARPKYTSQFLVAC